MLQLTDIHATNWADLPTIARCRLCGESAEYHDTHIITPVNPETATTVKPTGCRNCLTGSPNTKLEPTIRVILSG